MGKRKGTSIRQQLEANEPSSSKISNFAMPVQARDQKFNHPTSELKINTRQPEMQWQSDSVFGDTVWTSLVMSSCLLLQESY